MKHVDIWRQSHAKMILNIISSIFNDVQNEFMESDDEDDDNSDANVSGYHNEWDDFLNEDSFLRGSNSK